jgi:hypothetical protein
MADGVSDTYLAILRMVWILRCAEQSTRQILIKQLAGVQIIFNVRIVKTGSKAGDIMTATLRLNKAIKTSSHNNYFATKETGNKKDGLFSVHIHGLRIAGFEG